MSGAGARAVHERGGTARSIKLELLAVENCIILALCAANASPAWRKRIPVHESRTSVASSR
ncbi:MAG: hypothetical protein ABSG85_12780 [Spirochaetia bacterium]